MTETPGFDIPTAHRYFSAHCFNRAWELIEKTGRTPAEDEEMLRLSLAATWHWTQRPDCTSTNLSIGYWPDRPHLCPAGSGRDARRYAQNVLRSQPAAGREAVSDGLRLRSPARAEAAAGEEVSLTAT